MVVFGESNAGKTFWLLDLSLHVATGRSWCGRRVEHGGVVYCALEGTKGFRNRVAAWRSEHAVPGEPVHFAAIQSSLNLLHPDADVGRLVEAVKRAAASINVPLKLIVIDTLSRALAGGNENGPEDMGALVANMDRVRAETGAAVTFVAITAERKQPRAPVVTRSSRGQSTRKSRSSPAPETWTA